MKKTALYQVTKKNNAIYMTPSSYARVLFFMHGLGDCADSYVSMFNGDIALPHDIKIVLLNAEVKPVTINGGMKMPSWYDIKSFDPKNHKNSVDELDVAASFKRVMTYVDEEVVGLNNDYSKVFIGGFSQGGCMSLYGGLASPYNFGGIICLSGLLFPFINVPVNEKKDLPIFIGHGVEDEVIPVHHAEASYKGLFDGNYFTNLTYKKYDFPHTIDYEELNDLKKFFEKL